MKITKKAIATAPKYMVSIDYRAGYRNAIDFQLLNADNIFEAMQEAEKLHDENVYLLRILEKTGEVHENEFLVYADKLISRSRGNYHLSDKEHGEVAFDALWHVEAKFACLA